MKQIFTLFAVLILSLPSFADTPAAMITNLDGAAIVVTNGQKASAAPMQSLAPHTLIELRGGTKMTVVFFAEGTHEQYQGPALIGIGKKRGKVFHGADTARKVTVTNSALVKAIDPHALAEVPGNGSLSVSKAGGKTTLSWTTNEPSPYLVSLIQPAQGSTARTNIWAEEVGAKKVTYSGPVLNPNLTYIVEVTAGKDTIGTSQFRVVNGEAKVLSAAQAEADGLTAANPKDTTGAVLLSTVYTQHGMNDDASDALKPAIGARPSESAFIDRMNAMGKQVNKQANADTAYAQGFYQAEENWGTDAYYDPAAWGWEDS